MDCINEEQIYRTYSNYLKQNYHCKVYKLPINLPVTCPNRKNGTGCSFCAEAGTGFEALSSALSVKEQLTSTKEKIKKRYKAEKFIAYFQNYTNTFLPLDQFQSYMKEAAMEEEIVELSISTRPDCIREDYLKVLQKIQTQFSVKICIELGLQTVNYHTLRKIDRGHGLAEWLDAVLAVKRYGFTLCTHLILNLPDDTKEDVLESSKVISALPVDIVKLHSLYIPYHSRLYSEYKSGKINLCTKEEYLERLVLFVEHLRDTIVIERMFSRIPEEEAAFSNWGTSWWKLKDEFLLKMEELHSCQGIKCTYLNGAALAGISPSS